MQSLSVWLPKQMVAAHGPTLGKRSELFSLFIDLNYGYAPFGGLWTPCGMQSETQAVTQCTTADHMML